jgi:GTP-binding protein
MALVDELKVHIKAGEGGDGVVRWLHLKGKEFSGPAGGDGGRGGDVYVRAVRDLALLNKYAHTKEFVAEDGEDGMSKNMFGKNGEDLFIDLPVGTIITNLETNSSYELLEEGQTIKILSGGHGGHGNTYFKGATNRQPMQSTPGKSGEEADFFIELQILADAGLIGLPSAGKSSLLNSLTAARSKVAEYHFTTLEPHLGDLYGYVLADVPGLIEGASGGKGLGHKFLKHIRRTRVLLHCISFESDDMGRDYKVIRKELESFDKTLVEKPEIIILTKIDMVDESGAKRAAEKMKKFSDKVLTVTILDDESVKHLSDELTEELKN